MTDSTRQDFNYFNLPGDGYDLNSPETPSLTALDSTSFSSALKISHKTNIRGSDLRVAQCNENAVDITISHNVNLTGRFGVLDDGGKQGRADQVITIKGGCSNVSVAGTVCSRPTRTRAAIQLGNWMDQDYSLNRDIHLKLTNQDGSPTTFSTGWVAPFSVHGSGMKWLFWESVGLKLYWVAKWLVRTCLRIPKGVKGPSWM